MKKFIFVILLLSVSNVFACGISGTALGSKGKNADDLIRINTDWDSTRVYPFDGKYILELGESACGNTVEVYVNSQSMGLVTLPKSGNATLNVVIDRATGFPVH